MIDIIKNNKKKCLIISLLLFLIILIPFTYSKYISRNSKHIVINAIQPTYTIVFNANGGTGSMSNQEFTYNVKQNLSANTFTKTNYIFAGWNTEEDGSGTPYSDEQEIYNITNEDGAVINLYAQWAESDKVAKIGDNYYYTLQAAINAVPKDNTRTVITLLANTDESLTVYEKQNIVFNLQNYTVSNSTNKAVIENNGTIEISNGKIINSAISANGVINNNGKGTINISGGEIISVGTKQALYNNGGKANISGDAYLSSTSSIRAAVQNNSGTMTITGGTIISSNYYGLDNRATLTIGTKDDDSNTDSLLIQGKTYGIYSTKGFKYYDGTIKGTKSAIDNIDNITDSETGCFVESTSEVIGGVTYKVSYLDYGLVVTFNPNEGTLTNNTKAVGKGQKIGTLPKPTRKLYVFEGWFTARDGGTQITENTIINEDVEFFAHWEQKEIAEVNGTKYYSLQSAINAVPTDNNETTVKLLMDTSENVTVANGKNIYFDFQTYTLSNSSSNAVITNNGVIKINNGTINQRSGYAAINNNSTGLVVMSGGTINSTGDRSGIYNIDEGRVVISGNAYISSNTTGSISNDGVTIERGAVMNVNSTGTITILGGTIVGARNVGVSNNGTLVLGTKDGTIDNTSPVIMGKTLGVKNYSIFNYYDGIIKGVTKAIDGVITEQESDAQIVTDSEVIDGDTYKVNYLN